MEKIERIVFLIIIGVLSFMYVDKSNTSRDRIQILSERNFESHLEYRKLTISNTLLRLTRSASFYRSCKLEDGRSLDDVRSGIGDEIRFRYASIKRHHLERIKNDPHLTKIHNSFLELCEEIKLAP